jgi:hypothetical protein
MKKYNTVKKILMGFLLIAIVTACEDFLDVNRDPNNPTEVTPSLILPVGQVYTAKYIKEDRRISHLGNMLMYNWSEANGFSWYNDEFQYLVTTTFYAGVFDYAYENPLKQYHLLTELEDPKFANYAAIGKIMKSYHFQILVDAYGSVPYTEALGRSANATPKYDDAQFIYADLLVQLTEAIDLIKNAEGDVAVEIPGEDDVMFEGDMTEWIKFANTLKVRILTRQSDITSAQTEITNQMAAIAAEGSGFITDDVIVQPGFLKEVDKQNPFWDDFGQGVDGTSTLTYRATAATDYILDRLTASNDPRIDYLYEEPETGHLGVDQIAEPGPEYAYQLVSNIGPGLLKSATMGANIFTLAESNFNQAELAFKGFGGDPKTLYEAGIQASFDYLGAPDASDYYSQAIDNVGYDASTDKLEAIITQKWIAVNGITAEQSWFDYNRTGFPENLPIADEASTPDRPVRLFYPASELSTNALNVPSQPDAFTGKIFWAN